MPVERRKSFEYGAGIVEVLVAVFVLSVGLIGGLKLQSEAMRQSSDSRYVVVASGLAHDALDRIVYNRQQGANWNISEGSSTSDTTPEGRWLGRVKSALPGGKAAVRCEGGICTVQISWTPPGHDEVTAIYKVRSSI